MTDFDTATPSSSIQALSDALAALGTYADPPTPAQLASAEEAEGQPSLAARLSNALYGAALARVSHAEVAASEAGVETGYRDESWQAAAADAEGMAMLLHYTALRQVSELATMHQRLPVDVGVAGAASSAAEAVTLLLEIMTVRSTEDPRTEHITPNLAHAADHLDDAAAQLRELFATGRDAAAIIHEHS